MYPAESQELHTTSATAPSRNRPGCQRRRGWKQFPEKGRKSKSDLTQLIDTLLVHLHHAEIVSGEENQSRRETDALLKNTVEGDTQQVEERMDSLGGTAWEGSTQPR